MKQTYQLSARIESDSPEVIEPILKRLLPGGVIQRVAGEFVVTARLRGANARDLNRGLLDALRRMERRTRIRAEWLGPTGRRERFFDYVPL